MEKKFLIVLIASFSLFTSCNSNGSDEEIIINDDVTLSPTGDAVMGLLVPDNNYGDLEDIHLYAWTQGGQLNVNRVAMKFDLQQIPESAILDSAFLSLYFNPTSNYLGLNPEGHLGENSFIIQQLIDDWDEQNVTWNTQPRISEGSQVLIQDSDNPTQDYLNINVSQLLQNTNEFYGFLIRHQIEEAYKVTFLASSEHPDQSKRPTLRIYYHTIQ